MKEKRFLALTCAFLIAGCNIAFAHADDELFKTVIIKDGTELSVLDCVATAFHNSPKIKRKKYYLDIAKSNVGIAKSQYFPVIGAGVGFHNENNSNSIYYNNHYRELPNVGVSVNKMVWDFGRTTANIRMEEFYKLGAEYEFMDSLCSTLFDVKEKYYKLLKAQALLKIAENNVEINKSIIKYTNRNPDLITAKMNLNEAEVALLEAKNNYLNAKVDLNNAMYLDSQPDYKIKNTKTFNFDNDYALNTKKEPQGFEEYKFKFSREKAVQMAYDNSPDLQVLIATKNAMEQSLIYIKRTYFPELSANAGYGFNNTNQASNNSFQVGVNLNSSVNLMELKHSIKGADAQVKLADNEITLFKKDLYFEVKRAFNNYDKAERAIPTTQVRAKQALDFYPMAENLYKTGGLDYTALQDARKDYIDGISDYIESLYDYNIALIQVEMAMHYHLVDIHHKTEHAMCYHSEELINHLNEVLGCDEKEVKKFRRKKVNIDEDL